MCRFVEYATVREAESAIQQFDNFDIDGKRKLVVRVSEDRGRREERMAWMKREQGFLNSLHATGELDEFKVNEGIPNNPLEPRYIPCHPSSPEKPTPPAGEVLGPIQVSLGSSAGASSLKAFSGGGSEEGLTNKSPTGKQEVHFADSERERLPCSVCQKPTKCRCSQCKVPFCCNECMKESRSVHACRVTRGKKAAVKQNRDAATMQQEQSDSPRVAKTESSGPTLPGPLKIADSLDDDGFYVSLGSLDSPDNDGLALSSEGAMQTGLVKGTLDLAQASPRVVGFDLVNSSHHNTPTDSASLSLPPRASPKVQTASVSDSLPTLLPSQQLLDSDVGDCSPSTPPGSPEHTLQSPLHSQNGDKRELASAVADRLREKLPERGVNFLSISEILSVLDQCPSPLMSIPVGEFPPPQFTGILTNVFSPTQFHAIAASLNVKEVLLKLLEYGSLVTPSFCGQADLNEGALYGYIDDYGDFYRVELSNRSGMVKLCDVGAGLRIQTRRLFHIPEEIKSIPQICYQMSLRYLYYDRDKKKEGTHFLFSLLKGRPLAVTNHSYSAYKNEKEIKFVIVTLTSLDGGIVVADEVAKNSFATVENRADHSSPPKNSPWPMSRQRADFSPAKTDGSPSYRKFPAKSPNKERGEKDRYSAPLSSKMNGGVGSPGKNDQLLNSPDSGKSLFTGGSPGKKENLQNSVSKSVHQNVEWSSENRQLSPPNQTLRSHDGNAGEKYKLVHMSSKVPFHNPVVGAMMDTWPMVVLNPHIIWTQVLHQHIDKLRLMENDMNLRYSSRRHEPYAPTPGEMCVAKSAQDQKYYRVEVLCVNHSRTVDIHFVDYGYRDTVTVNQIHHIDPIFLSLPKQAFHFSLAGVVPVGMATCWNDSAVAYLKEKILNRKVRMKMLMQTSSSSGVVEVYDPDSPSQLINTSLVNLGLAQEASPMSGGGVGVGVGRVKTIAPLRGVSVTARQDQRKVHPNKSRNEEQPSLPTNCEPAKVSPPRASRPLNQQVPNTVADSAKTLEFGPLRLLKPEDFEKPSPPTAVESQVASFSTTAPPSLRVEKSSAPTVESPRVSLSLPINVSSQSSNSGCSRLESNTLRFRPFSTESPVSGAQSPSKSVSSPSSSKPPWPRANTISSKTADCGVSCQASTFSSVGGAAVKWSPSKPGVQGDLEGQQDQSKDESRRVGGLQAQVSKQTQRRYQKVTIETVQLKPNKEPVEAVVLFVEHPLKFWIQVIKEESLESFLNMTNKLNVVDLTPHVNPCRGEFCLCRCSDDGTIHRARIVQVEDSLAFVEYIDNGKREKVQLDSIFRMDKELAHIPAQAILCTLNQLLNPSGKGNPWKQEAIDFFKEKVGYGGSLLTVKCVNVVKTMHVVDMKTAADDGGKDLLDMMVEAKFGGSGLIKVDRRRGNNEQMWTDHQGGGKQPLSPKMAAGNFIGSPLRVKTRSSPPKAAASQTHSNSPLKQQASMTKVRFSEIRREITPPKDTYEQSTADYVNKGLVISSESSTLESSVPTEHSGNKPDGGTSPRTLSSAASFDNTELMDSKPLLASQDTCIPVSSLEKVPLPYKHETFSLLVTEVYSPDEFYIQTEKNSEAIDELCTSLYKYFSTNKPSPLTHSPGVGSLVCAKFSQDGAWYRAEVLESATDYYRVKFIDYGNIEMVQLGDMAECPHKFISLPILASCCCLSGVTPPGGDATWSDKATQLLKEGCIDRLLQAVIVNPDSSPPALKLTDTSSGENVDLSAELIKKGLASASRLESIIPNVASTTKAVGTPFKRSPVRDDVPSVNVYPMVSALKKVSLPPKHKTFSLLVTEVRSPDEFYIQTVDNSTAINDLGISLNEYFSTKRSLPLTHSPSVGSLVCAKFSQDGAWYRAEVLETATDYCRVKFIDYGNIEIVRLGDMAECPHKFISLPILASCCCLSGVTPPGGDATWPDKATQLLKEGCIDRLLQAVMVNPDSSPPALKLTDTSSGENVDSSAELIKKGLASASRPPRLESTIPNVASPTKAVGDVPSVGVYPMVSVLKKVSFPKVSSLGKAELPSDSEYFSAYVSEVWSPEAFFIQVADDKTVTLLDELTDSLNLHPPPPLDHLPSKGSLVCAKFTQDDRWYRSEVLNTPTNSCKVLFIDYGNVEVAKLEDVAPCPIQFTSNPPLATRCCLNGVAPLTSGSGSATSWSTEATAVFKQLACRTLMNVKVVGEGSSGGAALVELVNTTGSSDVNVASELINQGLADCLSPSCSAPLVDIPTVEIPAGVLVTIYVPHEACITDPSLFFVHYVDKTSYPAFKDLMANLEQTYSTTLSSYGGFVPQVGAICCCQFQFLDNSWYRCKVVDVSGNTAVVRSLDFGFTEALSVDKLVYLDPKYSTLPAQAVPCSLSGVKPVSAFGWSQVSKTMFKCLVRDRDMRAIIKPGPVGGVDAKRAIDLFTGKGNTIGESVAGALIHGGYASEDRVTHPELSEHGTSKSGSTPQSVDDEPTVPPIPVPCGPIPMSKPFPVTMTHFVSLSEFYLQVATTESLNEMCDFFKMVHDYAQIAEGFKSPPPLGSLCVAMYSDESWYRGQVVKIVDEETCSVFFFDFGNRDNVSLFEMKPIAKAELLSHPVQALKCGLYGASIVDHSRQADVVNLFLTLVPLESMTACRLMSKYPLLVDLECGSGFPTLSVREELARSGYIPKLSDLGMTSLPTNKLPTDYNPVVLLTEIKDPSNFWLQVLEKSVAKQFETLMMEIKRYADGNAPQVSPPFLGQLCIAKFSADGIWYRAKVIQMVGEGKVRVQFVDYGNEEVVDASQLKFFKHSFMGLPAQAIHCSLIGFKVASPNVADVFNEMVENKQLVAVNKGVPGEIQTTVVLIDTSGDDDVFVHSMLA